MDKELLFKGVKPEDDVELEGIGTIRVRALTRAEMQKLNADKPNVNGQAVEMKMLVFGMVDPVIDIDDAKTMAETMGTADWKKLTSAIGRLSGMDVKEDDQANLNKEIYKSI